VNDLVAIWPNFPSNGKFSYDLMHILNPSILLKIVQAVSDPTLSTLSSANLQSLIAFIQFTNLDSCTSPSTMPDEVKYTLRMQEYVISFLAYGSLLFIFDRNGANYYHPQNVKISENDYLWKRSPEDFCRGNL
jgi:hypothetical protein